MFGKHLFGLFWVDLLQEKKMSFCLTKPKKLIIFNFFLAYGQKF
jgi:hypothetical protein